jgi:isoleucyl-tRNA synthetase
MSVVAEKAAGRKCARSWIVSETVGLDGDYPDLTPRDAAAVRELMGLIPKGS